MPEAAGSELRCRTCDEVIVCCEFCDSDECPSAICYGCVVVALGESLLHPHVHGG